MLFGARVHDNLSYEQLPMVQRIMNTVEKTSTGVIPAEPDESYPLMTWLSQPVESKSIFKYGSDDKCDKYKLVKMHHCDNRGHGGTILPAYS